MTFDEWRVLVKGLKSVYTSERFLPDADSIKLWYKLLQDMDYAAVNAAAQKYILTNKFPPTVADIRESATEMQNGKLPDWGEAWEETCKAIKRYGFYRPKEALESLSPLTRETVNRLGFTNLCLSENPTADRANFRTCYEIVEKREQQAQILPLPLQDTIAKLSGGMGMDSKDKPMLKRVTEL